jgi:hypothetical protein
MPVLMLQYTAAEDGVAEIIDAITATFAEAAARQPGGIRYAYLRRPGTGEFIALLELDDAAENPLLGMEAARRLQATVANWAAGPVPAPRPLEVLGSYRLFSG